MRSPGATRRCVVEVHADEIGIAELVMLGPHSGADSGNPKPNLEAVAGYRYVGRSLLGGHGRKDQALDIRLRVGALIERPRILHRVCRHLDQAQIENPTHSELILLRTS